jgi:hypothetical protein
VGNISFSSPAPTFTRRDSIIASAISNTNISPDSVAVGITSPADPPEIRSKTKTKGRKK